MFVDTGRFHNGYIEWGEYTTRRDNLSRLCKTCGYAYGDHSGDWCPGIESEFHIPFTKPEFPYQLNKDTIVI